MYPLGALGGGPIQVIGKPRCGVSVKVPSSSALGGFLVPWPYALAFSSQSHESLSKYIEQGTKQGPSSQFAEQAGSGLQASPFFVSEQLGRTLRMQQYLPFSQIGHRGGEKSTP